MTNLLYDAGMVILINVLWLAGGQGYLWARRFLIAPLMASYAFFSQKETKKRRFALIFLVFIGILSLGYGENSWLKRMCRGSETAVRAVMACLISLVFSAYLVCYHAHLFYIPAVLLLNLIAWEIRSNFAWKFLGKDVLLDDICRATALSISVIICV